jgi:hypothetical protein
MPILPKGAVRRRPAPARLILGCPKICPEYALGALRALIKPQFKTAILHREPQQKWRPGMEKIVRDGAGIVADKLGWIPALHFPDAGDFYFIVDVDARDIEAAKALAVLLTQRLDGFWLTLGKWYIRRGKFFKRHRSHNILMQPASSVHLTRATRSALSGELSPCTRIPSRTSR